jgi:hypothetical protein
LKSYNLKVLLHELWLGVEVVEILLPDDQLFKPISVA